jgi:hypothetical protein
MSGRLARHVVTYLHISYVRACSHLSRSRIRFPPDYAPFLQVLLIGQDAPKHVFPLLCFLDGWACLHVRHCYRASNHWPLLTLMESGCLLVHRRSLPMSTPDSHSQYGSLQCPLQTHGSSTTRLALIIAFLDVEGWSYCPSMLPR